MVEPQFDPAAVVECGMQTEPSTFYLVGGFLAGFVVLWLGIIWLAATVSGWRRLAVRFADTTPFQGEITSFAAASIRFANYSGVLNLGVSELGVYLVPIWLFRPFHAPLFLPWAEIEATLRGSTLSAWRGVRMSFPSLTRLSITLYGRAVARVLPYVDQNQPDANVPYE
jgi:hypothetical protein